MSETPTTRPEAAPTHDKLDDLANGLEELNEEIALIQITATGRELTDAEQQQIAMLEEAKQDLIASSFGITPEMVAVDTPQPSEKLGKHAFSSGSFKMPE